MAARINRNETIDYASAVVDVISYGSDPISFNSANYQRTGWVHKHGASGVRFAGLGSAAERTPVDHPVVFSVQHPEEIREHRHCSAVTNLRTSALGVTVCTYA
jgi:hypothetical protein